MEVQQNTVEWRKQRLGKFTSSQLSDLMKSGKKKDEMFGDAAKTLMESVASERMLREDVKNNEQLFEAYLEHTDSSNKYTDWGHACEGKARKMFEKEYNVVVQETDCIDHPEIEWLAGSPDGVILTEDGEAVEAVIEIKCPLPKTHVKYFARIKNSDDLKKVKPEYYWQVQNNMFVTGAQYCYFISYCPWVVCKMRVVKIERNDDDLKELALRVQKANEEVDDMIAQFLFGEGNETKEEPEQAVAETQGEPVQD